MFIIALRGLYFRWRSLVRFVNANRKSFIYKKFAFDFKVIPIFYIDNSSWFCPFHSSRINFYARSSAWTQQIPINPRIVPNEAEYADVHGVLCFCQTARTERVSGSLNCYITAKPRGKPCYGMFNGRTRDNLTWCGEEMVRPRIRRSSIREKHQGKNLLRRYKALDKTFFFFNNCLSDNLLTCAFF